MYKDEKYLMMREIFNKILVGGKRGGWKKEKSGCTIVAHKINAYVAKLVSSYIHESWSICNSKQ